ncbi:MAG: hypothetical protein A2144_12480 [Chloroflexi bacterium RBG_16_50_9]|nr:MAG: hypothetical protein A2144_12480 [Chloroflexi bacterium RBG_16_50_9]
MNARLNMKKPSEKWLLLAKNLQNQNKELHVRSFRDFLTLSHITDKYLDTNLSADGINRTQRMIILFILSKCGFMTPTEISRRTLRTLDTVNKSIDGLDKMGITKSYHSKKDRRKREVTLTEKGLNLAEKTLPARYLAFSQAMDCFTKEEVKTFQSLLKRLREQIIHIMGNDSVESKKCLPYISLNEPFDNLPDTVTKE